MKDYLKNLPPIAGKCEICTINVYSFPDKVKPAVLPCGIENCPYEVGDFSDNPEHEGDMVCSQHSDEE